MKVGIIAPDWGNSWIPIFKNLLEEAGHESFHFKPDDEHSYPLDACIHMWARNNRFLNLSAKHIMVMRRYEFFDPNHWTALPWDKIEHLIFCNNWMKEQVDGYFKDRGIEQNTHLIYNAADTSQWTYRKRKHGKKIGMACHVHQKKNIPLALQILEHLPSDYELHIAGAVQDSCLFEYIYNISRQIKRKVVIYGQIQRDKLDSWWEDKNYCLSTSISEGNPNNVLEAMAKGIKPVVHAWPGAEDQFEGVFYTVAEAVAEILRGNYESEKYLNQINTNHSLTNYKKIVKLIQGGI